MACVREYLERFHPPLKVGGVRYWGPPIGFGETQARLLRDLEQSQTPEIEPLKRSLRRSIYRVARFVPEWPSIVIKKFPLAKLESRFKYRKYGLAEFAHYQQAWMKSVPTPRCHGYFEIRSLGMVKANGVFIEDLKSCQSLADLAETMPDRLGDFYARAIPIMCRLFEQGVNHIDTSPRNFMGTANSKDVRLIDWQYCAFVQPKQPAQLLLQAAHFLRSAELDAASETARSWLETLLAACGRPITPKAFSAAITRLLQEPKISMTDRLNLKLGPEVGRWLSEPE